MLAIIKKHIKIIIPVALVLVGLVLIVVLLIIFGNKENDPTNKVRFCNYNYISMYELSSNEESIVTRTFKSKNRDSTTALNYVVFSDMEKDSNVTGFNESYHNEMVDIDVTYYGTSDDIKTTSKVVIESNKKEEISEYTEEETYTSDDKNAYLVTYKYEDVHFEEVIIIAKLSKSEILSIKYTLSNTCVSDELQNDLTAAVVLEENTSNKNGLIDGDKLKIGLLVGDEESYEIGVRITLDANKFEEIGNDLASRASAKVINEKDEIEANLSFYTFDKDLYKDGIEAYKNNLLEMYGNDKISFENKNSKIPCYMAKIKISDNRYYIYYIYQISEEYNFIIEVFSLNDKDYFNYFNNILIL